MTTAIATQLKSITNTELIELETTSDWQRIEQAIEIEANRSIYLLLPKTEAALAAIVRQAAQQQWRILVCGNTTKISWGKMARNIQLVVSTQKCDRLIEHAVGDLTVTVQAGMKLKDLQDMLRSQNQFLPINDNYADATLGGIVATGDAGSWRQRYGGVRDLLLGLSFVRADGEIAKAGGRVVKNVAGYDLMKLFTGSYGTLGIMRQLTFRTYPLISTSQTLLLTGKDKAIAQATQTIRSSGLTPTSLDLLSSKLVRQLDLGTDFGLLMRWATIPASIEQQKSQVEAIAKQLGLSTSVYQDEAEQQLWQDCTSIMNTLQSDAAVICKFGIAPASAVDFMERFKEKIVARVYASSGIGQLKIDADEELIVQMRSHCQQHQGYLTVLHAPKTFKQQIDVWGYSGNALKPMQALKDQFDPQNILNPGRFIV